MRWFLSTLLLPLFLLRPAFGQDAKLIEAFDRVVYGTGLPWARERALRIEEQEVRLDLYGAVTPERLALLQALAADLSLLTGLAIVVSPMEIAPAPLGNPAPGLAQFQLHLLPPQAFPALLDQSWIPQSTRASHARSLCSFVTRGRETIRGALILIDATLAEAAIRHCLVEETAQAFGAIDDTTLLDPSAFNDWGTLVDRLQPDDRRILRALYDPRLRPGMTRAEVLPLLPELLKD